MVNNVHGGYREPTKKVSYYPTPKFTYFNKAAHTRHNDIMDARMQKQKNKKQHEETLRLKKKKDDEHKAYERLTAQMQERWPLPICERPPPKLRRSSVATTSSTHPTSPEAQKKKGNFPKHETCV